MRRHLRWLAVGLVPLLAGAAYGAGAHRFWFPADATQFDRDTAEHQPHLRAQRLKGTVIEADDTGTLRYLYDDFDAYGGTNSRLIDGMDTPNGVPAEVPGDTDVIEGRAAASATITGQDGAPAPLRVTLPSAVDLSRWAAKGYLTMWLKVGETTKISGVSVALGDAAGAARRTAVLPNLPTDYPNFPNANDPFVDLAYPEPTGAGEWTDFRLAPGWNFLPWRMDQVTDDAGLDLRNITWYEITFATTPELDRERIRLDDLRIADGLQQAQNALGGNWAPPLGMPQYGVYDVVPAGAATNDGPVDSALRLLNVRQSQYPSNGDHGRVLSRHGTPVDFAMRTRFALDRHGPTDNGWLRVLYDFDPAYDPGHDWFGGYFSLDYRKFGLLTVIPVERFAIQTQEPTQSNRRAPHRTDFEPRAGATYEYQITVRGQRAEATVYEVHEGRLYQRASVSHTFSRQRHPDRRYPIGIEITGNVKATVYAVELMRL